MTTEDTIPESCSKDEKDRRRINLLNDPNYGIVLGFLEKFRSILDLPNYPLQRFEDHLINYQERIPSRLIDFHFILLKRLSLAKNAQRDKFDTIITKFASRFDLNDDEYLTTNGYLQAEINIKIRIIKNLFESQFDSNQTLKNTLIDKSAREIRSLPLGRDRFGVSYWFFMDTDCFVRLFREDVDVDRTWSNVAKDRDELEKFIKLLITDSVVRKKFSDWTIDYEPFSSLPLSNEFEEHYLPTTVNIKEEVEDCVVPVKKKRGRPSGSTKLLDKENDMEIKEEVEIIDVQIKRKRGRPKRLTNSLDEKIDVEMKEEGIEPMPNDIPIKRKPGRPKGSMKLSSNKIDMEIKEEVKMSTGRGRKRKLVVEENNNAEEFKMEEDELSMDDISLSIRQSSRAQKVSAIDPIAVVDSTTISQIPDVKKKRFLNGKTKSSNELSSTTNTKPGRPRRRRRKTTTRRNIDDSFCSSTSSSDEHIDYLSENEYDSDDYLPNQSQIDIDDNLFELDEDNNTNPEQLRTAKTAQASAFITACYICSKTDRPEVLLLCDDCDDAYHLECLHPILLSIPDGDWFCPLCEHKKLSNQLISKFKELLINPKHISKHLINRKLKIKEYTSDESITASESEDLTNGDESISQINENSNLSSSYFDEKTTNNISQRGRHRRTRFDMNKILNNHQEFDDDDDSDTNPPITNFDLQLPKKITRLLHHRHRSLIKNDQRIKSKPLTTRAYDTSLDLNEKLGSPLVYVHNDGQIKSVITNSKQTLKIVRRWHDVQRRSQLRATNIKTLNERTISDCADENSVFCPDDISLSRSNDSHSNNAIRDDDSSIIRSKTILAQSASLVPIDKCSSRNIVKKSDANFDRLTRDIQFAVSEANLLPMTKAIDQQHIKRIQKTNFSPYLTKVPFRSLPLLLPKSINNAYKIFKSKDPPTCDVSSIILTPSSSSSLLDVTDVQLTSMPNS